MLITLARETAAKPIQAWLTRQGLTSRALQANRALLIEDPWVPFEIRAALAADPDVLACEDTHNQPQRVLRRSLADAELPWELGPVPMIAGPCAIESRAQILETADFLSGLGLRWLRGGTNKTRTSPQSFQGRGLAAAEWLREAADAYGLHCVTEVTEGEDAEAIAACVDLIQVGARHMHTPRFLQRLGAIGKPVLLKRGFAASPDEWLWAAEYLLEAGAPLVLFCERGIRTASPLKRFTLDLGAVPFIRTMTPFPILVDPSHAAGSSPYVAPLARAAIASGAHGVIVECHPEPDRACSDAAQALDFGAMVALVEAIRQLLPANPEKAGAR